MSIRIEISNFSEFMERSATFGFEMSSVDGLMFALIPNDPTRYSTHLDTRWPTQLRLSSENGPFYDFRDRLTRPGPRSGAWER